MQSIKSIPKINKLKFRKVNPNKNVLFQINIKLDKLLENSKLQLNNTQSELNNTHKSESNGNRGTLKHFLNIIFGIILGTILCSTYIAYKGLELLIY